MRNTLLVVKTKVPTLKSFAILHSVVDRLNSPYNTLPRYDSV